MKDDNKKKKKKKQPGIGMPSSLARRQKLLTPPLQEIMKRAQVLEELSLTSAFEQLRESMQELIVRDPLEHFREIANAVKPLNTSQELSESLRAFQFDSPLQELQSAIDKLQINPSMQELAERIRETQPQKPLVEQFEEIIKSTDIRNSINDIANSIRTSYSFAEIYDNIFVDSTAINSFEVAYKDIFTRFIFAEAETGDREKAAQKTANSIKTTVVNAPKSTLSIEFYINMIITLAIFIYTLHLNHESEERIIGEVNKTFQVLYERLDECKASRTEVYLRVLRSCNLREKPTSKNSRVIAELVPQALLKYIDKSGNWFKVEYFDNSTETIKTGWCYGKFFDIIKHFP